MKFYLTFTILVFPLVVLAQSNAKILKRLAQIEKRLIKLEATVFDDSTNGGLKVKNYGGKTIDEVEGPQFEKKPELSPEQWNEMKKQVEMIRKNQEKTKKYLDELMNEY